MSLKMEKTIDLNLVVHQFVKTTKANYRTMLKVSQNGNTIQHLSFLPSKKRAKTYHGRYEKYKHILIRLKDIYRGLGKVTTKHLTFCQM